MSSFLRRFKKLFGFSYSNADLDSLAIERLRRSDQVSDVLKKGHEISFRYKGTLQGYARTAPHSDMDVAHQVLVNQEYQTITDFFKNNFPGSAPLKIIDAGANVGYSAIFFMAEFPSARIACIEPDNSNLRILERNLAPFIEAKQVQVFRNGLLNEGGKNIATQSDFRDGKDWSVSISELMGESELKSITVSNVMQAMGWDSVDIIKMDIEGSERFVFDTDSQLDFLDRSRCLAIEIHDEFEIREHIYALLLKHGFVILNFAETTFAISRKMFRTH